MRGRWAILDGGDIENVAVWDGVTPWPPGDRSIEVPDGAPAEPGGRYRPAQADPWERAPRGLPDAVR